MVTSVSTLTITRWLPLAIAALAMLAPTEVEPVASTTTSKPSACATNSPSSTAVNFPACMDSANACGLSAVPTATSPYPAVYA